MLKYDVVGEMVRENNFKPDNLEKVKAFTNAYIEKLININDLDSKEKIIYLSGPITGVGNYKERFRDMELDTYKAFTARNVYVLNTAEVISELIEDKRMSYNDISFVCFGLMTICDIMIYDDSDDKYEKSIGVNSELGFAMGNKIEILKYSHVKTQVYFKDKIIKSDALAALDFIDDKEESVFFFESNPDREINNKRIRERKHKSVTEVIAEDVNKYCLNSGIGDTCGLGNSILDKFEKLNKVKYDSIDRTRAFLNSFASDAERFKLNKGGVKDDISNEDSKEEENNTVEEQVFERVSSDINDLESFKAEEDK